MSKKELLSESQIRRFMTLANLEPLAKNVLSEKKDVEEEGMYEEEKKKKEEAKEKKEEGKMEESLSEEMEEEESEPEDAEMPEMEDEEEPEGGEDEEGGMAADASVEDQVEQIVNLVMKLANVQGKVMRDEEGMEEPSEEPSEEPMDEAGYGDMEEMDPTPTKQLSEDALVEAVLARVTARLVQEAKKKAPAKKETPEQRMKRMKAEKAKKKKTLEEATSAEGGGPLLKQGKNKYDVYKGHADMAYAKGKEGKGGHQMEPLAAKAEHSVTHGGKNLATLGGNKTKV